MLRILPVQLFVSIRKVLLLSLFRSSKSRRRHEPATKRNEAQCSFVVRPPQFHQSSQRHSRSVVHRFSFCADGYAFFVLEVQPKYCCVNVTRVFGELTRIVYVFTLTLSNVIKRFDTKCCSSHCCRSSRPRCRSRCRCCQCCHQLSASGSPRKSFERIKCKFGPCICRVCNRSPLLNFTTCSVCVLNLM